MMRGNKNLINDYEDGEGHDSEGVSDDPGVDGHDYGVWSQSPLLHEHDHGVYHHGYVCGRALPGKGKSYVE